MWIAAAGAGRLIRDFPSLSLPAYGPCRTGPVGSIAAQTRRARRATPAFPFQRFSFSVFSFLTSDFWLPLVTSVVMTSRLRVVLLLWGLTIGIGGNIWAAEETGEDSAAGLPESYAKNYLVARSTMSPDGKFGVIYPTVDFSEAKEAKDFLVALKPFRVLAPLPTKYPYFQHESHGGIGADWLTDGSATLITLESKWGPGDVFLVEFSGGAVKRITSLLDKVTELLRPKFRAAKPKQEAYNDNYDFIFEQEEGKACSFGEPAHQD